MKHQPFENWILLDEPLNPEQAQALQAHLRTCEHCRALQSAWGQVDALFQAAPTSEPAPGFATRWQARLTHQRALQAHSRYRWQSWITLILIANAVSLLAVVLGLQFVNTFQSLTEVLLVAVYRLTSFITVVNVFQNLLAILIRTLPGLLPPVGWASVAAIMITGSVIWIFSLSRLARISWRAQ